MKKKRKRIFNALMVLFEAMNEEEGQQIVMGTFEYLKEVDNGSTLIFPFTAKLSGEIVNAYDKKVVCYER